MSYNEWGSITPRMWEHYEREQARLNRLASLFLDNAKLASNPVLRFRRWPLVADAKPTTLRVSASLTLNLVGNGGCHVRPLSRRD